MVIYYYYGYLRLFSERCYEFYVGNILGEPVEGKTRCSTVGEGCRLLLFRSAHCGVSYMEKRYLGCKTALEGSRNNLRYSTGTASEATYHTRRMRLGPPPPGSISVLAKRSQTRAALCHNNLQCPLVWMFPTLICLKKVHA